MTKESFVSVSKYNKKQLINDVCAGYCGEDSALSKIFSDNGTYSFKQQRHACEIIMSQCIELKELDKDNLSKVLDKYLHEHTTDKALISSIKDRNIKSMKSKPDFPSEKENNEASKILDGWKHKWKQPKSESKRDKIKHHDQNEEDAQYPL